MNGVVATVRAFLEDRHVEHAKAVEGFAGRVLRPRSAPGSDSEARIEARALLALMGQNGLFRSAFARQFGGTERGPDYRALCLAREAVAAASPLADAVLALQALGGTPIALSGNHAVAERWLPEIATGDAMAAFAMTEPDAGSDVAAIATRAVADGDGWLLHGRKSFISNAGIADVYVVFATLDPSAGHRGIAAFAVPAKAPGVRFARAQVLSEPHPLGEIAFEACRVPAESMLATAGEGFKLGLATLDRLRPTVAAAACGMARRALEEAATHVAARKQFGRPLADFQLVQQKLARMATDLDAARLLTFRAAWMKDGGSERIGLEAAEAKLFATEAAQRIIDDAVQLLGGRGVLAESPVDRLYRAVRALRIYEGTSEIQHLVIARELLR